MNFTKGLVCTILNEDQTKNKEKKLFFFEIDTHDNNLLIKILDVYEKYSLDVIFHKTFQGYHFISPTLINLEKWKEIHKELLSINPKCPMICLRVKGNKYPNEDLFFFLAHLRLNCNDPSKNVESICIYLNKIFDFEPKLQGKIKGDLVLVSYKPKIEAKNNA